LTSLPNSPTPKKNPHTSSQNEKNKKRMKEIVTKPENGLPFHFLFLANRQEQKKPNLNKQYTKNDHIQVQKRPIRVKMGSKEAERKKQKTKLHIPVDDESTNRERDREEDGFCEGEMRAKVCVCESVDGANTASEQTPRS